mgnify:FL=1
MGMGKFGQGDPTKTQHRISSSNTGTHHLAGDLIIEGDLSVSGSTSFASGGSARSVAGDTDNGIITWKTSDNTFIVESGVLITADGNLSASKKLYVEKDVEIADNLLVSGSVTAGGGISIPDDQTLKFGTDNDVTVEYDEDGNDVLLFNNGFRIRKDDNSRLELKLKNNTNDTAGESRIHVQSTDSGAGFAISAFASNYAGALGAEGAGKAVLFSDAGASALAFMSSNTGAGSELQFYTKGRTAANKRVVITSDGHLSASQKLYVEKDVEIADNLQVSGTADVAGQLSVGPGSGEGVIASRGDHDLKLKTGNSTTGVITITDGANGDITFSPNGTGDVVADGILKPNDGITIDKGSAGAVTVTAPDGSGLNGTVTGMENQRAGTFVATMASGGSAFTFSNDSVISIQVANNVVVSTDVIAVTATTQATTGILAGCIAIAPSSNFFRIGLHNVGGGDVSPTGTVTVNWAIL